MLRCPSTAKNRYLSKTLAETALVEIISRSFFQDDQGPVAVYQCDDCGDWHLTSKGPKSELLEDDQVKELIRKNRIASSWESKWRR